MANYFYKWIPVFILGTIFILGLPWLGLIAVIVVAGALVGALAALAFAIARAVGALSRAISHVWRPRSGATHGMARALSPAGSARRPTQLVPVGPPSERDV